MALPPPLVRNPNACSARYRLRGPPATLKDEFAAVLRPEPTTVSEDGAVRFGDTLLLLSHGTEVLLQSDVSREVQVVDDSHSQRREFTAFLLTTARVLEPCARNAFSVARASREDGFGQEDLRVHYGQPVRLLASGSLPGGRMLHLHLQEPASAKLPTSTPVLLPRAAGRTTWKVMQGPRSSRPDAHGGTPDPKLGDVVCINEPISLENVETSRLLMSTSVTTGLIRSDFGAECSVFAEDFALLRPREAGSEEERRRHATWSFVNELWADAVKEADHHRTGGIHWKEDEGDDFIGNSRTLWEDEEDIPAFQPLRGAARKEKEDLLLSLVRNPRTAVCVERILPGMRAQGMHGARKFRRSCVCTDVMRKGFVAVHAFVGILGHLAVRLSPQEVDALCRVFCPVKHPDSVDYLLLFEFMGGIMAQARLDTLKRAYRKLRRSAEGSFVTVDTLLKHWNPQCYPGVTSGRTEEKHACSDFASQWEVLKHDGHVSPEDFLEYYQDVSLYYEETVDFIEMLRVAWDL